MTVPVRLAAALAALGLVLLAGLGLGRLAGPVAAAPVHGGTADEHGGAAEHGEQAHAVAMSGLAVSAEGYTLRPGATTLAAGTSTFRFSIAGPDGSAVTRYDVTHERELHLVVVRRDGTGFQHLHPARAADGTWSTPLTLDAPGPYRAYADFAPAGQPARTLAADLVVPGDHSPQQWPAPADRTSVDGFDVRLSGSPSAGEERTLRFDVTRGGAPVALQPYLGAAGHLVALREGDLGYLHVHPEGDRPAFALTAPSAGRYRLYLQFQVDGVVHTAQLVTSTEA